jgi:S1-C subfamily serine protease
MKRASVLALTIGALVALAPASFLRAQTGPAPIFKADVGAVTIPKSGKAGKFAGPALGLPSGAVLGPAAGKALAHLPPSDTEAVRGAAEAALYRRIAPSVVLIVTDKAFGSGSFITKDGEIITNHHVVGDARTVGVLLKPAHDGDKPMPSQVLTADVIRYDEVADLALVKLRVLPKTAIVPVALGDFSKVGVGDDVSAIGHPEGEAWTYTRGLVSQVRRDYEWDGDGLMHKYDVIQTQTPINPGNSGGPLLNEAGQMIGVNTLGGGQGLNFAVGIDEVQRFLAGSGNRDAQRVPKKEEARTAAQPPAKTDCQAKVLFEGRNDKNDSALRQVDLNCDGKADLVFVLPDDTSKPMMAVFLDESGKPEGIAYSTRRDGYWNISYWDSKKTGSGKWDTIGYHPDGKLLPTSYGPYSGD